MKKINFCVTGDTHDNWDRLLFLNRLPEKSTAVIVLGDLGANFAKDRNEISRKDTLNSFHNYIYAVRGNHDIRPEDLPNHISIYDENVKGEVWCEPKRFPYIRYLKDGGEYEIEGHSVLVIGGAYSVDKMFRLMTSRPWYPNEQLSVQEQQDLLEKVKGKSYDFVLTHTCPFSWQPTDLFLPTIDQTKVDKTMENFLETVKNNIDYKIWLFGHFHDDRIIRKGVEMFYKDVQEFEEVYDRWSKKDLPQYTQTWNFDPNYDKER